MILPDKSEFMEKFFSINPAGDPERCMQQLIYCIQLEDADFNGEIADFDYIIRQYKTYVNWWKETYGKVEKRYLRKENELVDPYHYLARGMYMQEFNASPTTRHEYLFDNKSIKVLTDSLHQFFSDGARTGKG